MATVLAAIEQGDGRPLWELHEDPQQTVECDCGEGNQTDIVFGVGTAISCSDGDPVTDTPEELDAWFERLAAASSFADVWAIHVSCS